MSRETRLCKCGGAVEDESHVTLDCPITTEIRQRFGVSTQLYDNIGDLMEKHDISSLISFIDYCMNKF